jgi:serine phosphatase RsbU (regulator of sigma subunit)
MLRLHIVPAEGSSYDRVASGDTVVIGRALACDISIPDLFLSREHAKISRGPDGWLVEDLGSQNGTLINGVRIAGPTPIGPGDQIQLAGHRLNVVSPLAPADPVPSGTVYRRAAELVDSRSPVADGEPELRRHAERLAVLNDVHRALSQPLDRKLLVELVLDRVFDHLQPEEGAIFLRDEHGALVTAAARTLPDHPVEALLTRSLIQEVLERGLAALVVDVQNDERFAASESMTMAGVRSLLAAPLPEAEGSLGMIVLASRLAHHAFSESDMELLASLASAASLRLRNLALAERAAEARHLEQELALARRIQVALLATEMPAIPGWEVHAGNRPSRGVSGDYYQVRPRLEGRELVVMVSDVAGKGMAASLLTATLEALSAVPIEDGHSPESILARLSRQLWDRTTPEKYATAFLAALEPATGRVRYASAGHLPGLLVRADGTLVELGATGTPLGLLEHTYFPPAEVQLEPGDTLALYTDGFTEAANHDGDEFGIDRLARICQGGFDLALHELVEAIETELEYFVGDEADGDDRTLVLVRRASEYTYHHVHQALGVREPTDLRAGRDRVQLPRQPARPGGIRQRQSAAGRQRFGKDNGAEGGSAGDAGADFWLQLGLCALFPRASHSWGFWRRLRYQLRTDRGG